MHSVKSVVSFFVSSTRTRAALGVDFGATLVCAFILTGIGLRAAAADFKRVAYDDAGEPGQQAHLLDGDNFTFTNPGTDRQAARTCVFGDPLVFGYQDLNPRAVYQVKLGFFTDGPREMLVKAGTCELGKVAVQAGKSIDVQYTIPPAAYADGKLALELDRISGPNAVLSELEILSDDPKPVAMLATPAVPTPQLSPRPTAVAGCASVSLDLAGTWKFAESPQPDFAQSTPQDWKDIQVPGEWVMQGFTVKPGSAAGYHRSFKLPSDWANKRVILRCDGVYSDAAVFINGKPAGSHLGGFTPFELDVTALLKPTGENTIALAVTSESLADRLACGSQYACHPLGGITRKIKLFVLPVAHLSALRVATKFDSTYRDATLDLDTEASANAMLALTLTAPDGHSVPVTPECVAPGHVSIPVANPLKWDNEHPQLYTLSVQVRQGDQVVETVTQRIGFRQVEVRANQVFVNNVAVKLHGVCRHEVHPLLGRSLTTGLWRRDAEIYRDGNCNFIRTSHYPPDEEFIQACDELGLFVELEAPLCWVGHGSSNTYKNAPTTDGVLSYLLQANLETVAASYNHPSVIIRSLANESSWSGLFARVHAAVSLADPTRPATFHDQCIGSYNNHGSAEMPIANFHYPKLDGPAQAAAEKRPVQFGEYSHLNAYNRLELATDPGLRDLWGQYLYQTYEKMYAAAGCLGGSIWAAMDDTFYLPNGDTVGYGTWGPVDGWRREKPEYWNMKKTYSPLRVGHVGVSGNSVSIDVENRLRFSNLNEMKIAWQCGDQSGSASADVAPAAKGILTITLGAAPIPGATLALTFTDPRGFIADQFNLALAEPLQPAPQAATATTETGWQLDEKTGLISSINNIAVQGPQLMLLALNGTGDTQMTGATKVWQPFTEPCTGWVCDKLAKSPSAATVTGHYANAKGSFTYTIQPGGVVAITYDFTVTTALNPRQIGLVVTLPRECEVFSWERKGFWDVYPADHIARLKGTVKASEGFEATSVGPRSQPSHPWRLDNLPYGNNDFCSTKHHITTATLADTAGHGITVEGHGTQHIRCWRNDSGVHVLIADYSNGGSEPFLGGLTKADERPLKPGDKITGTIQLIVN